MLLLVPSSEFSLKRYKKSEVIVIIKRSLEGIKKLLHVKPSLQTAENLLCGTWLRSMNSGRIYFHRIHCDCLRAFVAQFFLIFVMQWHLLQIQHVKLHGVWNGKLYKLTKFRSWFDKHCKFLRYEDRFEGLCIWHLNDESSLRKYFCMAEIYTGANKKMVIRICKRYITSK